MIDVDKITLKDEERQPVECWCRCMGYYRPISQYNVGKRSEFDERKWYSEDRIQPPLTAAKGE